MFDWLRDLIGGIGDAIANGLGSVWNTISSGIWNVFLQWIYRSIYDTIANFFSMMGNLGIAIFDLDWVKATVRLFLYFGWGLFVVGLTLCIFDIALEYQTGRVNIKTTALNILKGFMAVNLFTVVPIELYKFCVTAQNILSKDLSSLFAASAGSSISGAASAALAIFNGASSVFNLLLMIALGYCVVKIFFANLKRGGILLIQIAVGSLYMCSLPRGYADGFTQWCKQIVALCLTAFLQVTLLYLGLLTFSGDMLLGIGIMLSANEVPRIAQQFGLDTSARANISSMVYTTSSAVNLTRSFLKK